MSGGVAVEFRRRWPDMHAEYVRRCAAGELSLGDVFTWETPDVVIHNLATQRRPGADARLGAIASSVTDALADTERRGLPALGLPRLGAGIGGLNWADVEAVLREASAQSAVDLVVAVRPT